MSIDLPKPKFAEPCNGCGLCCKLELCHIAEVAVRFSGMAPGLPCSALQEDEGRYRCILIEGERIGVEAGVLPRPIIAESLGVGLGCQMPDDEGSEAA